jgi:apolipoprotein N-acyltransferase
MRKSVYAVILFLVSLGVVALGQPALFPLLAPIAAVCGYALIWRVLLAVPTRAQRFWVATLWYSGVQGIQLFWLTSLTDEYRGGLILAGYGILTVWLGVQFGLLSLFLPGKKEDKLSIPLILAITSCWTLIEWSRLYILCGFSLNPAGMALTAWAVPLQFASVLGILGLSFWVILVNLVALKTWMEAFRLKTVFALVALALVPYAFGFSRLVFHQSAETTHPTFTVALVQTGLLVSEKTPVTGRFGQFIHPIDQWRRMFSDLKVEKRTQFDLIVLPEAVVPFGAESLLYDAQQVVALFQKEFGESALQHLAPLQFPFAGQKEGEWRVSNAFFAQSLANLFQAEVVAGLDSEDKQVNKSFNAAFHFIPQRVEVSRYEKRILLPFAESIPFNCFRHVAAQYGLTAFFEPGVEAKVFHHRIPLSVSICYEETFGELMRQGRQKGAELFVNVTNDNWYPQSRLPEYHFFHGRVRAVENGVPLMRACNTGVTAAVDSLGRIVARLDADRGVLSVICSSYHIKTLYAVLGDVFLICFCFATLTAYFSFKLWRKRSLLKNM